MLGENPSAIHSGNPSPDSTSGKNSNPIKKSAVGGFPRKILTTFHLVQEEEVNEETTVNICGNAVSSIQEIVDFVDASSQGDLQGSDIVDYIQKQENILKQCIRQLENSFLYQRSSPGSSCSELDQESRKYKTEANIVPSSSNNESTYG